MEEILARITYVFWSGQLITRFQDLLLQNNIHVTGNTVQATFIIIVVFLFALLLGVARHHMLAWSIKGAWFGIFFGILLTLLVEAFLLVGGRTALVETLNNEKIPKTVRNTIREGTREISNSLNNEIPMLSAQDQQDPTKNVISLFSSLKREDQQTVERAICLPASKAITP